jgi:uncharacterized membrane protein YqiK
LKGEAEAEAIRNALEATQWRRKEAAELLGICYKALIYKSKQYGIITVRENAPPRATNAAGMRHVVADESVNIRARRLSAAKAVGNEVCNDRL